MKNKTLLTALSAICSIGVIAPIACSCASNTQSLNKSIEQSKEQQKKEEVKNIKVQLSNPKDKYGIDKVVKINGSDVYQNVFRFRTNNADTTSGRNLDKVESGAFQGNKTLQHVSYSYEGNDSSVKLSTIGKGAFQGCSELESVKIPSSCANIGERAFFRCEKLSYIDMSSFDTTAKLNALTSVGTDAFNGISTSSDGKVVYNADMVALAQQETTEGAAALKALQDVTTKLRNAGVPDSYFNADYIASSWSWSKNDTETASNDKWKALIELAEGGSDAIAAAYPGKNLIGESAWVYVNGLAHEVRIIGIDHDDLSNDLGKAALTFEFANLISDSNGQSIAVQWNDTSTTDGSNFNYLNSSVRYHLTGNGSYTPKSGEKGTVWFSAGQTSPQTDSSINGKTVYDMLPTKLQSAIKSTKHYVATTTSSWSSGVTTDTEYNDTLFIPNYQNLTQSTSSYAKETKPTTYAYYKTHDEDQYRLKHQTDLTKTSTNTSGTNSVTNYTSTIDNYAGYWYTNSGSSYTVDDKVGGRCWLASPGAISSYRAWICSIDGVLYLSSVYSLAYGVAPCFCIGQTLPSITTTSWEDFTTDVNKIYTGEYADINTFAKRYTVYKTNATTGLKTIEQATSATELIGQLRLVKVNGLDHKVRIIGTNHDTLTTTTTGSTTAALTFEFANLISDKDGYSLATTWDGDGYDSGINYDYLNSNVFYNLEHLTSKDCSCLETRKDKDLTYNGYSYGKGGWYQKAGTAPTTDTAYANKSVWEMIYEGEDDNHYLTSNIKQVQKTVATTSGYALENYNCKLFLPTATEMNADVNQPSYSSCHKVEGSLYSYYNDSTQSSLISKSIKKQVSGDTAYTSYAIAIGTGSTASSETVNITNYAGYNDKADATGGGICWLASPYTDYSYIAWRCSSDGGLNSYFVYSFAYGVAPCFCI